MSSYIKCNKCGREYHDKDSIKTALDLADEWADLCRASGRDIEGLGPCPITNCEGEFELWENLCGSNCKDLE